MKLHRPTRLLQGLRDMLGVYKPISQVRSYVERFADLPFVLIHIPKNGGTSILDAFAMDRPRVHATAWETRTVCGAALDGKELVAIYRDPLARFESALHYYLHGGNGTRADRRLADHLARPETRESLESTEGLKRLALRNRAFWPQVAFALDPYGRSCIDRLFAIDDLNETFARYCDEIGIETPRIEKRNTRVASATTLSDATVRAVREQFACDYALADQIDPLSAKPSAGPEDRSAP